MLSGNFTLIMITDRLKYELTLMVIRDQDLDTTFNEADGTYWAHIACQISDGEIAFLCKSQF